jgi:amidase
MTSTDRAGDDASAIALAVQAGDVRAADVVAAHLDAIRLRNPCLNALVEVFADEALASSERIDRSRAAGSPLGPLAGIPVSVKMNIDVAGHAATHGIPAFEKSVPSADSPVVARLKAADAVIIGRANMPDMSLRLHTSSQLYGPTMNMFDRRLSPGGSSGGDAVAVASRMASLGLGNDAGGSVRVPASFAGICALKPTTGRFPSDRMVGRDLTYASQIIPVDGFLARSVEDLALAMRVAAGADIRDPRSLPIPATYGRDRQRRIGVVDHAEDVDAGSGAKAALTLASDALRSAGFTVVPVTAPELETALNIYDGLIMTEFAQAWPTLERLVGPDVKRYLGHAMALCGSLPLGGYLAATSERMRLQRLWLEAIAPFDAWLAPVYCGPMPEVDADIRSKESHAACTRSLRYCRASSLVGFPAVSVSIRSDTGLPAGVQLISAPFDEGNAIHAAREIEHRLRFSIWSGAPMAPSCGPQRFSGVAQE